MEIFISAFSQIFNSTCSGWAGCNTDSALNQSLVDCKMLGCIKMCLLNILRQTNKHLINSFHKIHWFCPSHSLNSSAQICSYTLHYVHMYNQTIRSLVKTCIESTVKSIICQNKFYSARLTNLKNVYMDWKYLHIKRLPKDHHFMNLRLLWSV